MKNAGKIIIGILFFLFSVIFLLLSSLYFQLLNPAFVFSTFESDGFYQELPQKLLESLPNDPELSQEERQDYGDIAKDISPELVQNVIETNFTTITAFIKGTTSELIIIIPPLNSDIKKIEWSLKDAPQAQGITKFQGSGKYILATLVIDLLLLTGLFFLYKKINSKKGATSLFIITGIIIAIVSIILTLITKGLSYELLKGIEPSQKILGLLASSLFPKITLTWSIVGIILLIIGILVKKVRT